jgi:hypothetical protein
MQALEQYIVTGKCGNGTSRVEWQYTDVDGVQCERVCRIYGSTGNDPLVTVGPITVDNRASIAAIACLDAANERRTISRRIYNC